MSEILENFLIKYQNEWIGFAGVRYRVYTLALDGWQGSAAPYVYTINGIGDINRYSNILIVPNSNVSTTDLDIIKSAFLVGGKQTSSSISIVATGDKPTKDIDVRIIFDGMMTNEVEITSLAMSADFSVGVGNSKALAITTTPSYIDYKSIRYSSSNELIAKVNYITGVVTGVAIGMATITACSNDGSNLSSSCTATVF